MGSNFRRHPRISAMFFNSEDGPQQPGKRFEDDWAKTIGSRVQFGGSTTAITASYPVPTHSFTTPPKWGDSCDQLTRLFRVEPKDYRELKSKDECLVKTQNDFIRTLGPGYELTPLLGGATKPPVQQEVEALSALLMSVGTSINNITRLRRDNVFRFFRWRQLAGQANCRASKLD